MALNGINNSSNNSGNALGGIVRPPQDQRPHVHGGHAHPAAPQPAAGAGGLAKSASPAAAGNALPVEAPAGTDPELWSVLTASERTFFAKSGAMGPLTYGRIMTGNGAPTPPAGRGGRLDVKV